MKRNDGKTLSVRWSDGTEIGQLYHTGPIYFTYTPEWLATGHNLSPLRLTFDGQPHNILADGCHGLPGFIADALPDAWGTRVAEAIFAQAGWGAVTPMKLLAWVGDRAPGALAFVPALQQETKENWLKKITTERLVKEAREVLRGQPGEIAAIALAGGSAGGAYPKALVIEHPDGTISLRRDPLATGDYPALLKLGLPDRASLRMEYAYLLMAQAAGIELPDFHLIGQGERPHLLIRRFDWLGGRCLHLHSVSGLWHRPKSPMDYSDLFRAAVQLGLPQTTVVEIARRLLFNLYAANRDDHGKNHAFLYDRETKRWRLSPAFDLTYTPGMLSRGMTIGGEVEPSAATLAVFLRSVALSASEIAELTAQVLGAIGHWPKFAAVAEVSEQQTAEIAEAHQRVASRIGPN